MKKYTISPGMHHGIFVVPSLLQATPVVPSEEPVQVFGYLQKQGRRLKGWHQRWFEIRGQHMYHYKTNAVS